MSHQVEAQLKKLPLYASQRLRRGRLTFDSKIFTTQRCSFQANLEISRAKAETPQKAHATGHKKLNENVDYHHQENVFK